MGVIGWKLDRGERAALLERFRPRYPEAVADHITLEKSEAPLPPDVTAKIVGHADDGEGRSEEHTSELQSRLHLVCRLLLEKKKKKIKRSQYPTLRRTIRSLP